MNIDVINSFYGPQIYQSLAVFRRLNRYLKTFFSDRNIEKPPRQSTKFAY